MRDLPVGVVSADAIEHLEPLALSSPDEAVALLEGDSLELVDASRNDQSPAIALPDTRLLASAPRSGLQVLITAVPLLVVDLVTIFCGSAARNVWASIFCLGSRRMPGLLAQGSSVLLCYFAIGSLMGLFPATAVSPVLELRQLVRSCLMACGLLVADQPSFWHFEPLRDSDRADRRSVLRRSMLPIDAGCVSISAGKIQLVGRARRSHRWHWVSGKSDLSVLFSLSQPRLEGRRCRRLSASSLTAGDQRSQISRACHILGSVKKIAAIWRNDIEFAGGS